MNDLPPSAFIRGVPSRPQPRWRGVWLALAFAGTLGFGCGLGFSIGQVVQGPEQPTTPRVAAMSMGTGRDGPTTSTPLPASTSPIPMSPSPVPTRTNTASVVTPRPVSKRDTHPRRTESHQRPHQHRKHRTASKHVQHRSGGKDIKHRTGGTLLNVHRRACARFEGFKARVCRSLFDRR
jgi:hypothetical protein